MCLWIVYRVYSFVVAKERFLLAVCAPRPRHPACVQPGLLWLEVRLATSEGLSRSRA